MDLISQVQLQRTVQIESRVWDMEAATYCTFFFLRSSAIVTEVLNASRAYNELVTTQPNMERLSPHIWLFTSMLRSIENVLANKSSAMTHQNQGKAEAVKKFRTTVDNQQLQDMLA